MDRAGNPRIRTAVATMLAAGLTCLALTAGLASAHTVSLFIYTGKSISGKGTTYINNYGVLATGIYESGEELPWHFSGFIAGADIHQQDGNLIVFDDGYAYAGNPFEYFQGMLSQFTGSGVPVPFSGLTQNVNAIVDIPGYTGAIAVDNSGTSTNGNIYIHTWDNIVRGYDPSGTPLTGNFPINFGGESVSGLAVAPDGKIWVAIRNSSKVVQFTNGGAPTGVEIDLGFSPGWIETDGNGNLYVTAEGFGDTVKFNSAGTELFKVETEQFSSSVGVDPANGNVYIAHGGHDQRLQVRRQPSSAHSAVPIPITASTDPGRSSTSPSTARTTPSTSSTARVSSTSSKGREKSPFPT